MSMEGEGEMCEGGDVISDWEGDTEEKREKKCHGPSHPHEDKHTLINPWKSSESWESSKEAKATQVDSLAHHADCTH